VRMTMRSPLPDMIKQADMDRVVPPAGAGTFWARPKLQRRPDG
jgi:hypothetical protein